MARMSAASSRRSAMASAVWRPCLRALALPFGAPGDVPPCIRQRPFRHRGRPARRTGPRPRPAAWAQVHGQSALHGVVPPICSDPPVAQWTRPRPARPPAWKWTCSTVIFCWPLPRCLLSASRSIAQERDSLFAWLRFRAVPRRSARRSWRGGIFHRSVGGGDQLRRHHALQFVLRHDAAKRGDGGAST